MHIEGELEKRDGVFLAEYLKLFLMHEESPEDDPPKAA
jgi:hypothetical protein